MARQALQGAQSRLRDLVWCQDIDECPAGLLWSQQNMRLPDHRGLSLVCDLHGELASARIGYGGKSFLRGGPKHFGGGAVENLYDLGAKRNVETFYRSIVERRFDNPPVRRAVDGTLAALFGREAALRGVRITRDELLKENKRLDADLRGLKT